MLVQMQWQLIPETTMHAFDTLYWQWSQSTNLRIGSEKNPEMTGNGPNFFSQWKNDQCGSKNSHAAVPEKLTIIFFGLSYVFCFVCFRSVSYAQCCLCLWVIHSWLSLRFSLMSCQYKLTLSQNNKILLF